VTAHVPEHDPRRTPACAHARSGVSAQRGVRRGVGRQAWG
jgi:hypothetical protein